MFFSQSAAVARLKRHKREISKSLTLRMVRAQTFCLHWVGKYKILERNLAKNLPVCPPRGKVWGLREEKISSVLISIMNAAQAILIGVLYMKYKVQANCSADFIL